MKRAGARSSPGHSSQQFAIPAGRVVALPEADPVLPVLPALPLVPADPLPIPAEPVPAPVELLPVMLPVVPPAADPLDEPART